MFDKILSDREERFNTISKLANIHPILVTLKANTPGNDKNRYSSSFLVNQLDQVMYQTFDIIDKNEFKSLDGPYNIYSIKSTSEYKLKSDLIHIEENHPLGRLVDLDLYIYGKMISRNDYDINPRKCLLCDKPAFICMKEKNHSVHEVLSYIDLLIYQYIEESIDDFIDTSILKELNLENKFGLVTPSSNGSHNDMNYDLMKRSKAIIKPYLLDILKLGFLYDDENLYQRARAIGLNAEVEMFKKTDQVNTYKGLIYILGFVLLSIGYVIRHNLAYNDLFVRIKSLAKDVLEDFNKNVQTAGVKSFLQYQITGIRGEVFNGLPTIQKAQKTFLHIDTFKDKNQHQLLLFFMIRSEDTVLLKRAGSLKSYQHFKQMAAQVNPYIDKDIKDFTTYCINHNISIGGSADLFIVFHFLNLFKNFYHHT